MAIAVLMPITCPARLTSGPPLLPGLMAFLTVLDIARLGADNPGRHRGVESERAAYRQHPVTHTHGIGISELGGREGFARVEFDHGQVRLLIGAHELGDVAPRVFIPVDEHPNAVHRLVFAVTHHHVIVGEDVAAPVQDHTRAQALLPQISLRSVGTEQAIEEIVERRLVR